MDFNQIFAIAVFIVAIVTIMSEKIHRTLVAIAGTVILLLAHVLSFDTAISHIDFNTLGVLFGMMLFVAVVRESGLFEFLAVKTAKLAKGDPWKIMVLFVLLTAVLSAVLDNVTTVLLIGPMTLTICKLLKICLLYTSSRASERRRPPARRHARCRTRSSCPGTPE